MIVRKEPNGELTLIGQTDHSRLVGQFAAHWGNDTFATPRPYESMARAAAFHDYGWLRYETCPYFDAKTGETPNFRNVPSGPSTLEAYEWCFDWLLAGDPYASLIANMHRTGLSRARYDKVEHPVQFAGRTPNAEMTEFVTRNEARQAQQRRDVDERELWVNYRLLQAWDLLGLYFSCQDPYEDYLTPVPIAYDAADADGVRITLTPIDSRRVKFDPFPFDQRPCQVQLGYRRLPQVTYPDEAAFRRAYFAAPIDVMKFELV
jgi:hypothetical protein